MTIRWLLAMAALAGCQSPTDSAREWFSKENSCPQNRVEARERSDLKPSMFVETATAEEPPKDVAADPERLKMWREAHAPHEAHYDMTGKEHIVEVHGCGKHVFYECELPQEGGEGGPRFWCDAEEHVPATVSSTW